MRDWGPRERVDVVVTNPAFGGMEEDGIEANFPAEFRTRETADLFLVLLMKILKPGDRAGLVLSDGTLFGEGVKTRIKAGNYNLDLKNPHNADTNPGDVEQLLPEYEKLLEQIAATREKLKAQLMEALSR